MHILEDGEEPRVGSEVKLVLWGRGITSFDGVYLGTARDVSEHPTSLNIPDVETEIVEENQQFSLNNGEIVYGPQCFMVEVGDDETTTSR